MKKLALRYVPKGVVHDDAAQVDMGIERSCWVGVFEFTEGQYWECFGTNSTAYNVTCELASQFVDYGAGKISYDQMRGSVDDDNINWPNTGRAVAPHSRIASLRKKLGFETIDLPNVNEWLYAARAGSTAIYSDNVTTANGVYQPNLEDADPNYAVLEGLGWFSGNSGSNTKRVGQKFPNAWGLYDVQGNQHEWGICYRWSGLTDKRARFGGCYQIPGWRCGLTYTRAIIADSPNPVSSTDAGAANGFRLFIFDVD